jgi:aminomethyltransferase
VAGRYIGHPIKENHIMPKRTPLYDAHVAANARMVDFGGWELPINYGSQIEEHHKVRQAAGMFDVSHMTVVDINGAQARHFLSYLLANDIAKLNSPGKAFYSCMLNEQGGVLDDLIITRWGKDKFFLVVNAACKEQDIAHLKAHLSSQSLTVLADQALLALQGPAAREVMQTLCPEAATLTFLQGCHSAIDGVDVYVTCSGYTGEDGYEISVPGDKADALARAILNYEQVEAIGLGARDSLRLEVGLCLYGHELSPTIDPVQAGLLWSISKVRRADGERAGGFPGADVIFDRIVNKPALRRVGLSVEGKRPVRDGQMVLDANGEQVGEICSAGYGATVGGPIAMAYIKRELGDPGTALSVDVRGKSVPVTVTKMPFTPQRYYRG